MKNNPLTVRQLTRIALMSALIAVCAWINIPLTVPFTLQLLGVFLALRLLGGRDGTLCIALYILLGAVGLPVFANFSAGLGALIGPTGGYILGFLLMGVLYWLLEKHLTKRLYLELTLLFGLVICYAFGTLWFSIVMNARGKSISFFSGLGICVFPFVLPDLAKLVVSGLLAAQLQKALRLGSAGR
ncbi:MAG: biotin transporter BioY [Clostridia bacterium]|nr:biotin transporter BioY [Clostridia bacterium]